MGKRATPKTQTETSGGRRPPRWTRYMMQKRYWSWSEKFIIKDSNDKPVYEINGTLFSWGRKLRLQDVNGNEVAYIKQRMLTLMPHYTIYRNGTMLGEIRKEFTFFDRTFTLDVAGPNHYVIKRSFLDTGFSFERLGWDMAIVTKCPWHCPDNYAIDIRAGEDDISILATSIVIELICSDELDLSGWFTTT